MCCYSLISLFLMFLHILFSSFSSLLHHFCCWLREAVQLTYIGTHSWMQTLKLWRKSTVRTLYPSENMELSMTWTLTSTSPSASWMRKFLQPGRSSGQNLLCWGCSFLSPSTLMDWNHQLRFSSHQIRKDLGWVFSWKKSWVCLHPNNGNISATIS